MVLTTPKVTYKESIQAAMTALASNPDSRFCGYGLLTGKGGNGMKEVPNEQIAEFTVAEGLMTSAAIGMSLMGLKPLVLIERADFLFNAMDAIVNHLDKAHRISCGEFNPCVIFRVIVGNKNKPLFTGATHTQNPAAAMRQLVSFPVYECRTAEEIEAAYERAIAEQASGIGSSMVLEFKDIY